MMVKVTCKWQSVVLTILLVGLAFVLGIIAEKKYFHPIAREHASKQVREQGDTMRGGGKYKFINPLLECDIAEGTIDSYKVNFRADVEEYIAGQKREGHVSEVAVYFRDLNNGPTFGVQENFDFIPASLLKVTIMMAYLRIADDYPEILKKEILYENPILLPDGSTQFIAPKVAIEVGKKYTVEELIERSIVYSDNAAVTLLIFHLDKKPLQELYDMLGARDNVLDGPTGRLTVKEYAAFFRVLFNSSYLSRKNSERALDLLARTDFNAGIVAGVPNDTVVAHKFGEGGTLETDQQIHDCGIVYYPKHPYLLCVMSRGKNISELENAIASISGFVYKKIDALHSDEAK